MTITPSNLAELLNEVYSVSTEDKTRASVLVDTIRKYKFWPSLQVKKFFSEPNLVLLHNTWKREDTSHFQKLYDECRSVVINTNASLGENVVVSYASNIPDRMTDEAYDTVKEDSDVCELAFEGPVVTVYYYNDKWFFGTTSCPTVDSSRYFHPTKTHGMMFDEALSKIVGASSPREAFTALLDKSKAYAFLLVHYENKHIIDYSEYFDKNDKYAEIILLNTRDRASLAECDAGIELESNKYKKTFSSPVDAITYLRTAECKPYGIVVKKQDGRFIKVSMPDVVELEEKNLGNPNPWINMLNVYIKNKQTYKITDYQKEFVPELVIPVTSRGRELAPTYLIHTIVCNMRDILFNAYINTTTYNPTTKYYNFNKENDATYAPIMRFHLAQLRQLQVTTHNHAILTPQAVYNYICHRQTIKNLRLLISYFAGLCRTALQHRTNMPFSMPQHIAECFTILDKQLTG